MVKNRFFDLFEDSMTHTRSIIETIDLQIILTRCFNMKSHVSSMLMMNMSHAESIEQQTKYRRTVDILAAILKVVLRGHL